MRIEIDLITTPEAAALLGLTPARVRQLAAEGFLPAAHRTSRQLLYLRSDVERLRAARRENPPRPGYRWPSKVHTSARTREPAAAA